MRNGFRQISCILHFIGNLLEILGLIILFPLIIVLIYWGQRADGCITAVAFIIAALISGIDAILNLYIKSPLVLGLSIFIMGVIISFLFSLFLSINYKGKSIGARTVDPTFKRIRLIHKQEIDLFSKMVEGIKDIPNIRMIGPLSSENRVSTISFVMKEMETAYVGIILTEDYNIATRTGVHCAPLIHKQWGTLPAGSTRLSLGYFNNEDDVDHVVKSVAKVASGD